jgi:hypothetical protein
MLGRGAAGRDDADNTVGLKLGQMTSSAAAQRMRSDFIASVSPSYLFGDVILLWGAIAVEINCDVGLLRQ